MTAFDRMERQLPELMSELASAGIPDYLDDMLQEAARTRQRPAWSALERWLPMGVTALPVPTPRVPWRQIALVALVALLAVAALATYAGSRPRVPAPFGPAANGVVVFSDAHGDIMAANPATGALSTLLGGSSVDTDPWFSNDGRRFAFDRRTDGVDRALFLANADGSDVHQLLAPAAEILWFDWSPDDTRFILSRTDDPYGAVTIVDAEDGTETKLELDLDVLQAIWRPNSDQLIVTGERMVPGGRMHGFYLIGSDGTGFKPIVESTIAINEPTVSPDGSTLAYASWDTGAEGRIHVLDIDTGTETGVDFAPGFAYTDLSPAFSPDGERLLVHRSDVDGYRLTILPIGGGPAVPMGAHHPDMTDGARAIFSPDGTKVLATYRDDGTTWLLDTVSGDAEKQPWFVQAASSGTWQRLAP